MAEATHSDTATVVLVHGAFADASSWSGVITRLHSKGVPVTAPDTRSLESPPTPTTSQQLSRRSKALCSPSDTRMAAR